MYVYTYTYVYIYRSYINTYEYVYTYVRILVSKQSWHHRLSYNDRPRVVEHNDLQRFYNDHVRIQMILVDSEGSLGRTLLHGTAPSIIVDIALRTLVTNCVPEVHCVHVNDQVWKAFVTIWATVMFRHELHDVIDTLFAQSVFVRTYVSDSPARSNLCHQAILRGLSLMMVLFAPQPAASRYLQNTIPFIPLPTATPVARTLEQPSPLFIAPPPSAKAVLIMNHGEACDHIQLRMYIRTCLFANKELQTDAQCMYMHG